MCYTSDFWFWVVDTYFWTIACGGPDRWYVPACLHVYEQSIYRLACALGGKAALPPMFQYIPSHAHLLWLAAELRLRYCFYFYSILEEGSEDLLSYICGTRCAKSLSKLKKLCYAEWAFIDCVCVCRLVTPMFSDSHQRVRYANCQCVYVLLLIALFPCTDHLRFQWTDLEVTRHAFPRLT